MSDTSIQSVIDKLKDKSQIKAVGMEGNEVYIEKSILTLAATYLEDYLYRLNEDICPDPDWERDYD